MGYKRRMPNRIVHFEIEARDRERAKSFYAQAFGWQMDQMGEDMGQYVVVTTGDPKEPGGINGGLDVSEGSRPGPSCEVQPAKSAAPPPMTNTHAASASERMSRNM